MPGNDLSSSLQFNISRESLMVANFNNSGQKEMWDNALALRKSNQDITQKLSQAVDILKAEEPVLPQAFAAFQTSYKSYQDRSDLLPRLAQEKADAWQKAVESNREFMKALADYRNAGNARINQALSQGTQDNASILADYKLVWQASELTNAINDFSYYVTVGFYTGDLQVLGDAIKTLEQITVDAGKLKDNSTTQHAKELIDTVIAALGTCKAAIEGIVSNVSEVNDNNRAGREARDSAIKSVGELADDFSKMTYERTQSTATAVTKSWITLIIGMATALILGVIVAWLLIRGIVGPLSSISGVLSEEARNVDDTSAQLSNTSQLVAEGNSKNATALEETSASVEELSSMTKRNADNSQQAQQLIRAATDCVSNSETAMGKVLDAMKHIASSGNEIGKIIKTIDDIAFQTNLLALNAAVEAARAGEVGAGFAVVADEVRNLAIRSADAAKNTAELIAQTIDSINLGSSLVQGTSETFQELVEEVKKVSAIVDEVAEASKEQSIGISQINTALIEMDQVTQSNAAISEETASAAASLSNEANVLDGKVQELLKMVYG
jgi:methyl-accepting chemotaxis protein